MSDQTGEELDDDLVRKALAAIARKRWANKTPEERKAHSDMMLAAQKPLSRLARRRRASKAGKASAAARARKAAEQQPPESKPEAG